MIRTLILSVWLMAPTAQDTETSTPVPAPAADAGAPTEPSVEAAQPPARVELSRAEREQIKRELLEEMSASFEEQRQKLRAEIRAQIEAEAASRLLEDDYRYREEKPRLELLELDGYFRVRPELFYKFDLERGADPNGDYLFPRAARGGKTLADVNMRWRIEPTLNVSEDVRLHAQIDVFDNLIFGATPDGAFGPNSDLALSIGSRGQAYAVRDGNWVADTLSVRRVYGEVVTPIGQFLFGRMGSHWGMGMLTNSGNQGPDTEYGGADFGDTVDRLMFVSMPLLGHYVVPFIDFVAEGPTSIRRNALFGRSVDLEQSDDGRNYGLSIARRDTDLEIRRKLGAGQKIINYGLYFVYRRQDYDAADFYAGSTPYGDEAAFGYVARKASFYVPDVWFKFQMPKFKLELELAGVFGSIDDVRTSAAEESLGDVSVAQFGGVARADFWPIPSLQLTLEAGFASGDRGAGMGNGRGRSGSAKAGVIDGSQFCLSEAICDVVDDDVNNFSFNPAYRVDLILWRELLQGVTDAFYIKPGIKYELTEGLDLWANVIYSRAIYGSSTPSSMLDSSGSLSGDANLGVEIDLGAQYVSGDGFVAGIGYGVLFPLAGLDNRGVDPTLDAKTAQTVRGWFGIIY